MNGQNEIKVSVIVPVYNVERYLERCVKSLINQTLREIEIILIDDGSTDSSGNMCDQYAGEDVRIRVFHQENQGQGIARNLGIRKAQGKYVCFLDSDDYLENNACQELFVLMEQNDADICCYGYQIETQTKEIVRVPVIQNDCYENERLRKEFLLHFFGDQPGDEQLRGFSSCMTIFRKSIIDTYHIEFPSEREYLSEDTIFSLEVCGYIKKALTTSAVYYHYCQNPDSFSQAFFPERLEQTLHFMKVLEEKATELQILEETEIRRAMYLWVNLMAYLKQGIRYYAECDKTAEVEMVKGICSNDKIRDVLKKLKYTKIPVQQKLLLYFILYRKYRMVIWLVSIRAKKRL